ncbi:MULTISPECIES: hypothetical protein [unclassified Sphingobium]|uniref:hypothetical protein n=1 Tax=unclassified Sphingobium TaxID=2611147 RepID=UPI0035A68391
MHIEDRNGNFDRRTLIVGSATAVFMASAAAVLPGRVLAQSMPMGFADSAPLIRMARDLFPHDRFADDQYQRAIATIAEQLAADASKNQLLRAGAALLDDAARRKYGRPYLAIEHEQDRALVLKTIESSDFFKTLRSGLVTSLYNQQTLWSRFGYEGSSAEKGGYIRRGFDDIDWLPA